MVEQLGQLVYADEIYEDGVDEKFLQVSRHSHWQNPELGPRFIEII